MNSKTDILKTDQQLEGKELDEKHFVTQMTGQLLSSLLVNTLNATSVEQKLLFNQSTSPGQFENF